MDRLEELESLEIEGELSPEQVIELRKLRLAKHSLISVCGMTAVEPRKGEDQSPANALWTALTFTTQQVIESIKAKFDAGLSRDEIERDLTANDINPASRGSQGRGPEYAAQAKQWAEHDRGTVERIVELVSKSYGFYHLDPQLDEAKEMYQEGSSVAECAAHAKISIPTMTQRLREAKITLRPPGRRPDNKRKQFAILLYQAGYPSRFVCAAVGSAYMTVRNWLVSSGITLDQSRVNVPRHLVPVPPTFDALPTDWKADNLLDPQFRGPQTLGLDHLWQ